MKRILLIGIVLLISASLFGQSNSYFNYQAVVRDNTGDIIANQNMGFKISILEGSTSGAAIFVETHTVNSNAYGQCNLEIGNGTNENGDLDAINWGGSIYFLKIEADVEGGTSYVEIGSSQLLSVPYSMHAKTAEQLDEDVLYFTDSDTLFAVKDREGNIVFAVFPDGAKVYVNEAVKGKVGGFSVSGRSPSKAEETEYIRITGDSTRIYVNEITEKGKVGGFAVSGRSPSKAISEDLIVITADSTRIYIPEGDVKGKVGGFAISGRSPTKAGTSDYFNVSGNSSTGLNVINPSEPRMLWYPQSEAFLVGRVLVENPDSVGLNSISTGYESKAIGDWSQAFGYKSIARSDYSTAIGKNAIADSINSFAFGNEALAKNTDAFAIGTGALATGARSFAFGSTGVDSLGNITSNTLASGENSFALGLGAISSGSGSFSIGANAKALGVFSISYGYNAQSNESYSTAIGMDALASGFYSLALGCKSEASGNGSVSVGYRNTASETFAFAGGLGCTSSGYGSVALGAYCDASVGNSVAMGKSCTASGHGSFAVGSNAQALSAADIAIGLNVVADGQRSYAFGAGADTKGKTGSMVFNLVNDKTQLFPSKPYEMNFKAENGFRLFAAIDTAEASSFVIEPGGNVGIGIKNPSHKLDVDGNINITGSYTTNAKSFADYVFEEDYILESIEEHSDFMWKNKHLPAIQSQEEIIEKGSYDIEERRMQMLEELEKAHIYIEQLNNEIKSLKKINYELTANQNEILNKMEVLEKALDKLQE